MYTVKEIHVFTKFLFYHFKFIMNSSDIKLFVTINFDNIVLHIIKKKKEKNGRLCPKETDALASS